MRQVYLASYAKKKGLLLFIFLCKSIFPIHSDLDTNFGTNGSILLSLNISDQWNQIALANDQKIIAAGMTAFNSSNKGLLARYNIDGHLDVNFGTNGLITTSVGTTDTINTVAIQSDGKILAGGFTFTNSSQNLLMRYDADGLLDAGFNGTGIVTNLIGEGSAISSLIIQPDGYILVTGTTSVNGVSYAFLARYDSSGNLDTNGFGVNGIAVLNNNFSSSVSVALLSTGDIIIGGYLLPGTQSFIAKFNSAGVLDTSFGSSGIVINSSTSNQITSLAIDIDDSIVVGGVWQINGINNAYLQRYKNTGDLDNSFGDSGTILFAIEGWPNNIFNSVVIQDNQKIVAAGAGGIYAILARYNFDGTLDTTLGSGGILVTSIGSSSQFNSVKLQTDGKILAGGASDSGALLMRFYANNTPFISIQEPSNGSVLTSRTTTISGESSELDAVIEVILNGELFTTVTSDALGHWNGGNSSFLINSSGSITAQVISESVVVASDTSNFSISAPDQILINDPVANSTIATPTPNINGYSSRPSAQVDINIDGVFFGTVNTDSHGNWNAGNSYLLSNGVHTISADLIVGGVTIATISQNITVNALVGPTGPQGNTGIDITSKNYLFAYDTTAQTVPSAAPTTLTKILFNNPLSKSDGWAYSSGDFAVPSSGLYKITYTAFCVPTTTTGSNSGFMTLVGTAGPTAGSQSEITGSASIADIINNSAGISVNEIQPTSQTFLANLTGGQLLSVKFAANIANYGIAPFNALAGSTTNKAIIKPSITLTITRLN